MLFSVDQRYYIVVMWCWSAQIYKHARCELAKCMNYPDHLDYKIFWILPLTRNIFLKHILQLIISQKLFYSRKTPTTHWGFSLELPASWVLGMNGSSGTAHSDLVSKNISIYPDKLAGFSFGTWTNINTCSCTVIHVQPNSLDGPLIGNVNIIVVPMFQFLV